MFDRPDEHTYTDHTILAAGHDLLAAALDTAGPAAHVLDSALSSRVGRRLAGDQAAAVRQVATSGRRVDLLVGPAGSGKTTICHRAP